MPSKACPHPEERPTGASRRTQARDAALVPILAQPRSETNRIIRPACMQEWSPIGAISYSVATIS
jgi:hypothetical protein